MDRYEHHFEYLVGWHRGDPMSQPLLGPAARTFVDAVARGLSDLSSAERADLVDQVEQRVRELESSGEAAAIARHLGTPDAVVADLRSSAGSPVLLAMAPSSRRSTARELGRSASRAVVDYLASLRPVWWALRGIIFAFGLIGALVAPGSWPGFPLIGPIFLPATSASGVIRTNQAWFLLVVLAVVASVALGLTAHRETLSRRRRDLLIVLNVVAIAL
jgi:uncharacterized membrane protein